MTISRRKALQALGAAAAGAPLCLSAQGRCMLTYGVPACNTGDIPPIFAPTGWKTTALDHVAFRAADYRQEAAFYIALMGWKLRSDDGRQAVLDMGEWGSAIFKQAAPGSIDAASADGGRAQGGPVRAVVESFAFAIDQWNATKVESELRKRGMTPLRDNDGKGFESFRVKDPDGWELQICNGDGLVKSRRTSPARASLSAPATTRPAPPSTRTSSAGPPPTTKAVRTS
jgi:catechol 2,3-dioxygenase-like lactoylglutathione lyase family enzyme